MLQGVRKDEQTAFSGEHVSQNLHSRSFILNSFKFLHACVVILVVCEVLEIFLANCLPEPEIIGSYFLAVVVIKRSCDDVFIYQVSWDS